MQQLSQSHPFAAATVLLRSEKDTIFWEKMSEIEDLDWDDPKDEDPDTWEPSG